jgi:hypothetical protein
MLSGCYQATPTTKPEVDARFPSSADAGDTVTVILTVTNPGPRMESIVVSFSRIGDPELPAPIVDAGNGGRSEGVADVQPAPVAVSPDGVIYRFAGLAEGASTEISFDLVMPEESGEVGNAVLISDGAAPERATGLRISIAL